MSNEEIYDSEIAPELLRLGKRCQEIGISFIASVEFDASEQGISLTEFRAPEGKISFAQLLTHWAANARGNVNNLFLAVTRYGEKHGHSSVYLKILERS